MNPYTSTPPFPVCIPLPVCLRSQHFFTPNHLLSQPPKIFYLRSLKHTRLTYVRNPMACLIQEAEEISEGNQGVTYTDPYPYLGMDFTDKYIHTYRPNHNYLHNNTHIYTNANMVRKTFHTKQSFTPTEESRPQMAEHTHKAGAYEI